MSAEPASRPHVPASSTGPCVLTIGNFDGVHLGHRAIIHDVVADAAARGVDAVALTFEPHPATLFRGLDPSHFRITTTQRRETLLMRAGIQRVASLPFTREFAALSPQHFVSTIILDLFDAQSVHVGYDFSFGKGATGTTSMLRELLAPHDVPVTVHEAVTLGAEPISSTRLRDAVRSGNLELLEQMLGAPYSFAGQTSAGAGRGTNMKIPTLNLYPIDIVCPPNGVYATRTHCEGVAYNAISNLGSRPSFDDGDRVSFETMVLGEFPVEGRGIDIEVELLSYIRDERAFESPDALRSQIAADVAVANAEHARRSS